MRGRRIGRVVGMGLVAMMVAGCATVKVKDAEGHSVGLEVYPAKPYVLLEKGADGVKASVVSLPDLNKPRFVKYRSGWGTAELSATISHGMLTTFGQKTDSKGPETITALTTGAGSLLTGYGAYMQGLAAVAAVSQPQDPAAEAYTTPEAGLRIPEIEQAAAHVRSAASALDAQRFLPEVSRRLSDLASALDVLVEVVDLRDPKKAFKAHAEKVFDVLDKLGKVETIIEGYRLDKRVTVAESQLLLKVESDVERAIELLKPWAAPAVSLPLLLEIHPSATDERGLEFVPVRLIPG